MSALPFLIAFAGAFAAAVVFARARVETIDVLLTVLWMGLFLGICVLAWRLLHG